MVRRAGRSTTTSQPPRVEYGRAQLCGPASRRRPPAEDAIEESIGRSTTLAAPWLNAESRKHQNRRGGSRMSEHVFFLLLSGNQAHGRPPPPLFCTRAARGPGTPRRESALRTDAWHTFFLTAGAGGVGHAARPQSSEPRSALERAAVVFRLVFFVSVRR